jgi:hypothetical protein
VTSLDDGRDDAREHPSLVEKAEPSWIARAFTINFHADAARDPASSLRALRLALRDRDVLVRAFALRGLALRKTDDLRVLGSKPLFQALVPNLSVKGEDDYVKRTAHALLRRLAGKDLGLKEEPWRTWWRETGEKEFLETLRARDAGATRPLPATQGATGVGAKPSPTRERDAARYITQARDQGLDVVIVMDVTPSMKDTLDRVRKQVKEITSFFQLLLGNKGRLGFVTYGDEIVAQVPLTDNLVQFARNVEKLAIWDDPNDRSVEEAPNRALELCFDAKNPLRWRKGARRVVLLIGDAPMHRKDAKECMELVEKAAGAGFILNTIICEPPAKYAKNAAWRPHDEFRELARRGQGMAVELDNPEELISRLLVLTLGSKHEEDLRRFVRAYREVTGGGS